MNDQPWILGISASHNAMPLDVGKPLLLNRDDDLMDVKTEKRNAVPAIVHVDGTGRLQTLTRENNGRFYELVRKFHEKTGVPLVLNTSFNRMGQPIIETPADAIACLLNTGLDCCVFEDRIVVKK